MNKITLSCGHECENIDYGISILIKDYNREGGKSFSYMMVCKECRDEYEKSDSLLKDEQAGYDWMREDKEKSC